VKRKGEERMMVPDLRSSVRVSCCFRVIWSLSSSLAILVLCVTISSERARFSTEENEGQSGGDKKIDRRVAAPSSSFDVSDAGALTLTSWTLANLSSNVWYWVSYCAHFAFSSSIWRRATTAHKKERKKKKGKQSRKESKRYPGNQG